MLDFEGRILTESRARNYLASGIWKNESLVDVLREDVVKYPLLMHKDEQQSLTYQEIWEKAEAVASGLYRLGIRRGDRVAMQMANTLDYVVAIFGAARIGAVSVQLQVDLGSNALASSLKQSGSRVWIVSGSYRGENLWKRALEIQKKVPGVSDIVVQGSMSDIPESLLLFDEMKNSGEKLPEKVIQENAPGPLDGFLIAFTSGTTGTPKGVVYLHANYLWATRAYIKNFGYKPGDGVMDIAPISHQTGMLAGIMMTLVAGGRIVLVDRFSAKRVLDRATAEKAAFIIGAPPHVMHIANYRHLADADLSHVRVFIYAGAPVPSTILKRLQEAGNLHLGCLFGWTEGLVATLTKPDDPVEAVSNTVGFAVPGEEIRLVDERGEDVAPGETGEVWSRGPNFCAGYYQLPEMAARQWDTHAWFHSGDLLYQDKEGRYHFVARADDIINRGGTKIDPKSVEDVLGGFPGVDAVNVVGAPHPTLGMQTVACIVLQQEKLRFGLSELRTYLGTHGLARFEFPDRLEFFDHLPLTESGKPKKAVLKEWVMTRMGYHHSEA
jgi:Acyl-CoA synthetases (AMP-forming)/AMP-acid ligases II